jgi:hypothetical protein
LFGNNLAICTYEHLQRIRQSYRVFWNYSTSCHLKYVFMTTLAITARACIYISSLFDIDADPMWELLSRGFLIFGCLVGWLVMGELLSRI